MKTVRVYDGALWCEKCEKCPVADFLVEENKVVIYDPHKPENGSVKMSVEEYNALIANARPIS